MSPRLLAVAVFPADAGASQPLPLVLCRVPAGFPSPADDYVERALDLNDYVAAGGSTFFVRVEGDSMRDVGIHSGDLLVVDRACEVRSGEVVVAALGGDLTVKRLVERRGRLYLVPESAAYEPVEVDLDLHVWGVVTHVVHRVR